MCKTSTPTYCVGKVNARVFNLCPLITEVIGGHIKAAVVCLNVMPQAKTSEE